MARNCQRCGAREPLVHFTQHEGKVVREVSFCEKCAAELGVDQHQVMSLERIVHLIQRHDAADNSGSTPLDEP